MLNVKYQLDSYCRRFGLVSEGKRIPEYLLQERWEKRALPSNGLRVTDGGSLEILEFGELNGFEGPDFKHAIVRIDGEVRSGDVEIHYCTSDWLHHGHSRDRSYDCVVLHVVYIHDLPSLEHVAPILELSSILPSTSHFEHGMPSSVGVKRNCTSMIHSLPYSKRLEYLEDRGLQRFNRRVRFFGDALMPGRVDWDQLFYRGIMEALGFSRNRHAFLELTDCIPYDWLCNLVRVQRGGMMAGAAALIGCGGLMGMVEDQKLIDLWNGLKSTHRFKLMSQSSWRLFRIRSANHPVRRLSGMASLVAMAQGRLFYHCVNVFRDRSDLESLTAFFQISDHVDVSNRRLAWIGRQRAFEIVVNAVMPILAAYFEKQGDVDSLSRIVEAMRQCKTRENNRIIREMSTHLGLASRSISTLVAQGMIEASPDCL